MSAKQQLQLTKQRKQEEATRRSNDAFDFFKRFFAAFDKVVNLVYVNPSGYIEDKISTRGMQEFHSPGKGGFKYLRSIGLDAEALKNISTEMGLAIEDVKDLEYGKTFDAEWALHRKHCSRDTTYATLHKEALVNAKLKLTEQLENSLSFAIYVDLSNVFGKLSERTRKNDFNIVHFIRALSKGDDGTERKVVFIHIFVGEKFLTPDEGLVYEENLRKHFSTLDTDDITVNVQRMG